jgi:hypothetical protein
MTVYCKFQQFDLEGQGHLWMKVKVSLVYYKVLSQGLLWPSMKTMHQELKKDQGTSLRTATAMAVMTVIIPLGFFFKKKSR